jgi:hypothetical protein
VSADAYVLLGWNDLGMHCMNQDHSVFSVLPPFNNLHAQLIRRGDAPRLPELISAGATIEYSIPGNTTSVNKTNFWSYSQLLFGVTLPPDVGLTGKGLTGTMDAAIRHFSAVGIPVTPFTDAAPTIENAYQQALLVARDGAGAELARSTPVIPVSVELSCVSAGCHASEAAILQDHERVTGFDPNATPILCARCHADPALGTTGEPEAGYFSLRMHEAHTFLDEQANGVDACYQCHPGRVTRCLRGVMNSRYGLSCQDCHGTMATMAASIDGGRVPWVEEPACRTCHTSRFGEPVGHLYRNSTGHGGVSCEGCHNSTHAEWPSRIPNDNANVIALQGGASPLSDCRVCHGVNPADPGPHDISVVGVAGEILSDARPMSIRPNPTRGACSIRFRSAGDAGGRLLVFDALGRTVRLLRLGPTVSGEMRAEWDGRDGQGARVPAGIYYIRWQGGTERAAARVVIAP